LAGVRSIISSIRVAEPRRWQLTLERVTQHLADRMLVNSESLRTYAIKSGIDADRLQVIPNYVNVDRFKRIPRGEGGDTRTVLFVGRLVRQKAVDVLLHAAALVERKDIHFRIVGDGEDRASLEALARSLQLQEVSFPGRSDRVAELLREADLFVLPSRWEGLPNVVLEAMAARCPVVGTDVTGTRDLIVDGENGLLVPADDAAALAGAIMRALDDESLRKRLVAAGFATAQEYSLSRMIAKHDALYTTLKTSP
jgi:glycosyltransferase involved in cell wall biosynthesis